MVGASRTQNHGRDGRETTTFFFSHFPEKYEVQDMWRTFQRWGSVADVFIAKRRNAAGQRFGFARFYGVEKPMILEKQLDHIVLEGVKIHVNMPKFRRKENERLVRGDGKNYWQKEKPGMEVRNRGRSERMATYAQTTRRVATYAQVTKGSIPKQQQTQLYAWRLKQDTWKGRDMKVEEANLQWLQNSLVGRMYEPKKMMEIREAFLIHGTKIVNVRPLGDNMVLLTGQEGEELEDMVKENEAWLSEMFESIQKWEPSQVPGHRLTWIKIYGLPLNFWSKECFKQLVITFGVFVDMATETAEMSCIEVATILVRTSSLRQVSYNLDVRINGLIVNICLQEDLFYCQRCKCMYEGGVHEYKDSIVRSDAEYNTSSESEWNGDEGSWREENERDETHV